VECNSHKRSISPGVQAYWHCNCHTPDWTQILTHMTPSIPSLGSTILVGSQREVVFSTRAKVSRNNNILYCNIPISKVDNILYCIQYIAIYCQYNIFLRTPGSTPKIGKEILVSPSHATPKQHTSYDISELGLLQLQQSIVKRYYCYTVAP
jgi:hypothetical protein